ncbi:unnamed protein product [Dovyalis caffra]|uniref:Uncharacterized protein n=1 Tax=Dovyalis caffra TaxID=77055 RepID=A0AAV1RU49_9ROSI|nr:unnamed protein product [Dovyalis caffra]
MTVDEEQVVASAVAVAREVNDQAKGHAQAAGVQFGRGVKPMKGGNSILSNP